MAASTTDQPSIETLHTSLAACLGLWELQNGVQLTYALIGDFTGSCPDPDPPHDNEANNAEPKTLAIARVTEQALQALEPFDLAGQARTFTVTNPDTGALQAVPVIGVVRECEVGFLVGEEVQRAFFGEGGAVWDVVFVDAVGGARGMAKGEEGEGRGGRLGTRGERRKEERRLRKVRRREEGRVVRAGVEGEGTSGGEETESGVEDGEEG